MIQLFQFPKAYGRPFSVSPFCAKLEAYFRLAKIDYKSRGADPRKAPKGKAPYIEFEGKTWGDSQLIVEWCKTRFGDPLDGELTAEQHGIGHALRITAENSLYFALVYSRWIDDACWPDQKKVLQGFVPAFLKGILPGMLRKGVRKQLQQQGIGRHSKAEIYELAAADIQALAAVLGDSPFFLGERPTSYDCAIYGPIAGGLATPADNGITRSLKAQQRLVDWVARMDEALGWA